MSILEKIAEEFDDGSEKKVVYRTSFGLSKMVFIVFLVLKLTHTIDWSWWWITSPLWIPISIIIIMLIIVGILALIAASLS